MLTIKLETNIKICKYNNKKCYHKCINIANNVLKMKLFKI